MLNLASALFIMAAMYALGKPRFQSLVAIAATIAALAVFAARSGAEGLLFSITGAAFALLLTTPLSFFGQISRTDVLVSIALGGWLGSIQYGLVFLAACGFLVLQRLLGIDASRAARRDGTNGGESSLLGSNEQSALVEIEAMKILRKDRKEFEELALSEGSPGIEPSGSRTPSFALPWIAKLALSTLAVLMIGTSI